MILALLPIVLAVDFGGVLWWTQAIAGLAVVVALVLAACGMFPLQSRQLLGQHLLLWPLFAWIVFAWFQTVPMAPSWVHALSGGSHAAYTEWINPFLAADARPARFPVSIASEQSRHSLAVLMMITGIVWASSIVFLSRQRVGMLLNVIALGSASLATFGLYRMIFPDATVFGVEIGTAGFGTFINRNNAALMLNLGFAASLGLLTWRLTALTGQEVDDPNFEFNDLFALISDRDSVVGVLSAALCFSGLLVCGSRGGLVACAAGMLLAFGWVRQRRGVRTIPVVVATVLLCVGLLIVPLQMDLQSIKRLEVFSGDDISTLLRDGRLNHWQDGWQTAVAHLPTGSGLGTYAYAYLPHQSAGSGYWFQHADNLWLELFVEQGILGILLAISLLAVWIRTLRQLVESADPMDQGIRVAGWYMVGAVVISQCFDFGLIIPANLCIVAIFVSAIVARGVVTGTAGGSIGFQSTRNLLGGCAIAVVALLVTSLAARRLISDGHVATIARSSKAMLPTVADDAPALAQLDSLIQASPRGESSPMLLDELSSVQYAAARQGEVLLANPKSPRQALVFYRDTGPARRRLQWGNSERGIVSSALSRATKNLPSDRSDAEYRKVLIASEKSLRQLPLGFESRWWQVYLDFIHQDRLRTKTALEQMHQIYGRNPPMLVHLGRFAADSAESTVAASIWRSALQIDPSLTVDVIEIAEQYEGVELNEVLPSDRIVFRTAIAHRIQAGKMSAALLARAAKEIDCDHCQTTLDKAMCQQLAADISYAREQFDQAFDQYRSAIGFQPTDVPLRLKYIRRLREQGNRNEALASARSARLKLPDEPGFTAIIDEMAAADIEDLESDQ